MYFEQLWNVITSLRGLSLEVMKVKIIQDTFNDPENQLFLARMKLLDILYNRKDDLIGENKKMPIQQRTTRGN